MQLCNENCIYCGVVFDRGRLPATKEHVIGRNFVPKGTLDGQCNLIAFACETCNRRKAALEDDLSALTMHPTTDGTYASDDPRLIAEARRKANGAISWRTKRPVRDSRETMVFQSKLGPATFTFNFEAPPQFDSDRVFELARFHVQAFFYLATFKEETRYGALVPGVFAPVLEAIKSDWGNPLMRGFASLMNSWQFRVQFVGADGFFKLRTRRHPGNRDVWAWAIEWNQSLRVVGFFGAEAEVRNAVATLPKLEVQTFVQNSGVVWRWRMDEHLPADEDHLFFDPRGFDDELDLVS